MVSNILDISDINDKNMCFYPFSVYLLIFHM